MTTAKDARRTDVITISPLNDSNYLAVRNFLSTRSDRPAFDRFDHWRYRECPSMRALVAVVGDKCIATMFALRRTYQTPDGEREFLEPFEWHASEEWRALAPGLRLVKRYMTELTPMIAVAGTDTAAGLFERLKWANVGSVDRYALALSGRFLASRGHGKLTTRAFDFIGRPLFMPRRDSRTILRLDAASIYAPGIAYMGSNQRRFALMRKPDESVARWLQQAPVCAGHYLTFHARIGNDLVGWVTARIFSSGGLRVGELLEVFLDDDRRSYYRALVTQSSATLAGFDVDALLCTTTCADTRAALKELNFRRDDTRPIYVWWGREKMLVTPTVLVDGAIADHSFFPLPTSHDALWLG